MDKLDMAVERLKEASAMSLHYYEKPLMLTYSGGKDSDAVQLLADVAQPHHSGRAGDGALCAKPI